MRYLFFFFLAVNIVLLIFNLNMFSGKQSTYQREPERLTQQRNVDHLKLVTNNADPEVPNDQVALVDTTTTPEPTTTEPTTPEPATPTNGTNNQPVRVPNMVDPNPAVAQAPTPATPTTPVPATPAVPATPTAPVVATAPPAPPKPSEPVNNTVPTQCYAWGVFSDQQLTNARSWLKKNFPKVAFSTTSSKQTNAWAVLIPGAKNAQQAEVKMVDLQLQGITDVFIIRAAGPNQYSISAGVFGSEDNAKRTQARLKSLNINAIIEPRTTSQHTIVFKAGTSNLRTGITRASEFKYTSVREGC